MRSNNYNYTVVVTYFLGYVRLSSASYINYNAAEFLVT
jgi:hypothetical protein